MKIARGMVKSGVQIAGRRRMVNSGVTIAGRRRMVSRNGRSRSGASRGHHCASKMNGFLSGIGDGHHDCACGRL